MIGGAMAKVTEEKLAANRGNARRSTGPRTAKGKARSSLNSVRHGLLSKRVVIRGGDGAERTAEFESLAAGLHCDLCPVGPYETMLVDRIAVCYWRLARAQRFEVGAVKSALDECRKPPSEPGGNIREIEKQIALRESLIAVQEKILDVLRTPPERHGEMDRYCFVAQLQKAAATLDPRPADVGGPAVIEAAVAACEKEIAALRREIADFREQSAVAREYDALADSRRPMLGAIPPDDELRKLIRYETMLDRELHRAIKAFERRTGRRVGPTNPSPRAT